MSARTRRSVVSSSHPRTLVELLQQRAQASPSNIAYRFLSAGGAAEALTYAQLDRQARATAAVLQEHGLAGERALLLFPPGLDYLATFFGCLYAGVVAVPAYPPHGPRAFPRLASIVSDARVEAVLTTGALADSLESHLDPVSRDPVSRDTESRKTPELRWIATGVMPDTATADSWRDPGTGPGDLAFLQYTSGSTRTPRGVVLTHANLMHNLGLMHQWFDEDDENVAVSWLPPYHDMGLIGGILEPLYGGFPAVLMSPLDFLQRPHRWLDAISHWRATVSAAPNFAYELCVRKVTGEQRKSLDLSSWRVAVNGAEPVRLRTLERFAETFAGQGFRPEALRPAYGLAEATLLVTTDPVGTPWRTTTLAESTQVGCGLALGGQQVVVVDTVSLRPQPPGAIGEIWLSGPSVAGGYWGRATETEAVFQATLPGQPGVYLRTGDLGAVDERGHLFVAGRLKDLIIIAGRNIYPQDVERAAEASHPALRPGCGAAFSVPDGDQERLVVVQEAAPDADVAAITAACRAAVREECETDLYDLVLVAPHTVPKTSSGKIQRQACRQAYLADELVSVGRWRSAGPAPAMYAAPRDPVEDLLAAIWADLLDTERVGIHDDFFAAGGHSLLADRLVARVRAELPVHVSLGDVFEAPTVAKLAALLGSRALSVDAAHLDDLLAELETD
jgi:acyl-CoA synthetase (AMP-forming)/AMP-acid ligase II